MTCLYEQDLVALLLREQRHERLLRHQQLALEDAVAQCGDEAQTNLPIATRQHDVVTKLLVQHVGHRVGIRVTGIAPSGIGFSSSSHGFARSASVVAKLLSNANARFEKARARRGDSRIPRLIQIQAAGIVSWQQRSGSNVTD